jgi:hypothetical protein
MNNTRPAFLITIDTEGDNLWASPTNITTENVRFLPRFQHLCERYGLKPTWLTDFEMADCPRFREFGRDVLNRGAGEIGMHLHAWNSPPLVGVQDSQAYLIEYALDQMAAKIKFMTDLLHRQFECKMVSHRAGRWAFDSRYARLLVENGYRVDCSVTPHVDWTGVLGDPYGAGGIDYTAYPAQPYFMDLDRIDRMGDSPLLEVPVTIVSKQSPLHRILNRAPQFVRRASGFSLGRDISWLRPNGRNREAMLAILRHAVEQQWPCVEFMLHSSELMAGGSPRFQSERDIEALYEDMNLLFAKAAEEFRGQTLSEFYGEFKFRFCRKMAPKEYGVSSQSGSTR